MEKGFTIMQDLAKRAKLESWLERQTNTLFQGRILPVTHAIAKRWGVFDGLRQLAGRPLNVPDGLIAATALEHGLVLVTRNVKDFDGLGVTLMNPWGSS